MAKISISLPSWIIFMCRDGWIRPHTGKTCFLNFCFPASSVLDWHTVDAFTRLLSLYNLFKLVKKVSM